MWTLYGPKSRFCDGISRRSFLKIGSLGIGGLTLADLLNAEENTSSEKLHKSVIMVYLSGGISHQDTFDLKPHAAKEIRGEFSPIDTNVPGIQISEKLPKLAQLADKFAILRSLVGLQDEHTSFQNLTGYPMGEAQRDQRPNFGSVVSQIQGAVDSVIPPFVDLFPTMIHYPYNSMDAGYLGSKYNQIKADGEDLASMKLRYISEGRFGGRRELLEQFDRFRSTADSVVDEMSANYARAFDVLTSSKIVEALDVEEEDAALREQYGKGSPKHLGDGAPLWNDQLLVARRLVETGVRVITVAYGFWDTHGNNFGHLKTHLPKFDQGIAALIEDIYQRDLDKEVMVIVWDEFGRTPKINNKAGRDHWAPVNCALLSGGGLQTGQVVGSTDKEAGYAASRPVDYRDVLATAYHHLGIDTAEFIRDAAERPVRILQEHARPIRELI